LAEATTTTGRILMPKMEIERKVQLSRAEAGRLLTTIGKALASGPETKFEVGHDEIELWVADRIDVELEIEIDGNETELEIELKWKAEPDHVEATGEPEQAAKAARKTSAHKRDASS
jgi:amphi-Trp domain-containing protein